MGLRGEREPAGQVIVKKTEQEVIENMIRKVKREDIPVCIKIIKNSFMTVAEELGFTVENAPRFTAFAISLTTYF